jgi:dTDP-4-dehydrorhamnose reductase
MGKKTIIFGSSGILGSEIRLQKNSDLLTYPPHSCVDITNFQRTYDFIRRENPDRILHLAAIVGARECEKDKKSAYTTNVLGTKNLSEICLKENIKLIYMSTDSVFDGEKGNYSEEDVPNPINYYSFTKFAGECFVGMVPPHLIIRSSFLPKGNFPYTNALTDQYTTRISVDLLAKDIILAIDKNLEGIIHIGGERDTLYNIARKSKPDVGKMTIKETGLKLPKDLSLDSSKWRKIKNGS